MAGIDDNRQMAFIANIRNCRYIQGIAAVVDKGAYTPLTQNHILVATLHDVLRGHKPFVDGSRHASFQKNRPFRFTGTLQQAVVLHIASADLDDIRIFFNQPEGLFVHNLGDHRHAGLFTDPGQDLQAFLSQSLEGIG